MKVQISESLLELGSPLAPSCGLTLPLGHWPQACGCAFADLPSKASSSRREHSGKECSQTENCCLWWPFWATLYIYSVCSSFSSRSPCGLWKRFKFPFWELCAANSGGGSFISEVGWHSSKQQSLLRTERQNILNIRAVLSKDFPGQDIRREGSRPGRTEWNTLVFSLNIF